MRHATGNKAWAIDDRTGLRVKYQDLRTEWNGRRVHKDEWEEKHPQLTRKPIEDAVSLIEPRPGNNTREDATVFVHRGLSSTTYPGERATLIVSSTASPTGAASTMAHGTAIGKAGAIESGQAITAGLGTVGIFTGVSLAVTGFGITSGLGDESLLVSPTAAELGVQTSGAVGDEIPQSASIVLGTSTTMALGSIAINVSEGWGGDGWGQGAWGE